MESALWWIVGAFLVAGLLNWAMSYAQTYLTGWVGERILADLRNTLFRHLQRLSLGFYERNRAGVIISRLTNDVEALDQLVTDGVTTLVQSTLFLFGTAIIAMTMFSPRLQLSQSRLRSRSAPGRAWRVLFVSLTESANICPPELRGKMRASQPLNYSAECLRNRSRRLRHERFVKIDDAVGLAEAKRRMDLLTLDIFDENIGGEFAAALAGGPTFGRSNQCACDTLASRCRHDIKPFEESDGRRRTGRPGPR